MPYKEQWKRTEAVRRFRRRQRAKRERARELWNPSAASQGGISAQGSPRPDTRSPATGILWGISALTVLAAIVKRRSS
jgi:hypothetical protein